MQEAVLQHISSISRSPVTKYASWHERLVEHERQEQSQKSKTKSAEGCNRMGARRTEEYANVDDNESIRAPGEILPVFSSPPSLDYFFMMRKSRDCGNEKAIETFPIV